MKMMLMKCFTVSLAFLVTVEAAGGGLRRTYKTRTGRRLESNSDDGMYRLWVHYKENTEDSHEEHDKLKAEVDDKDGSTVNYDHEDMKFMVVTVDEDGYHAFEDDELVDLIESDQQMYLEEMPSTYQPENLKNVEDLRQRRMAVDESRYMSEYTWHMTDRPFNIKDVVPYGVDLVEAQEIWDVSNKGAGIKVCVLDTGMYQGHQDFNYEVFDGERVNDNDPLKDPDYYKHPWDEDGHSHGTHVTGTIAALDNGKGVLGVAPGVSIHVVKVFSDQGYYIWGSDVAEAALRCAAADARVINMSLSGPANITEESTIYDKLFKEYGILSVAASGNTYDTRHRFPSSYDSVVSVGAVDWNKKRASFSTMNDRLEVSAPGVAVLSSNNNATDGYAFKSGTSMATPHVAGVAALLMAARPDLTDPAIFREALNLGVTDMGNSGRDNLYGFGVVSAKKALDVLNSRYPRAEPDTIPSATPSLVPSAFVSSSPSRVPTIPDLCDSDQEYTLIEVQAGDDGDEITTQIRREDMWIVFDKSYRNNKYRYYERCMSLERCWTFVVKDSGGDGMKDGGFVRLSVEGKVVFEKSQFGLYGDEDDSYSWGDCDPVPDRVCEDDNMLVEMTVFTDASPHEIETKIERDDGRSMFYKTGYSSSRVRKYSKCLSPSRCYTFTATDSEGNGIEGPGYVLLEINNEEKLMESSFGFGDDAATYTFGSCQGQDTATCSGETTPVSVKVRSDTDASSISTKITRVTDGTVVFERNGYTDNTLKTDNECLDLSQCYRFEVFDSSENGVKPPGYVSLLIADEEKHRVDTFGRMSIYEFGTCSPPDKVCKSYQTLVKFTVSTDSNPHELTASIIREDGRSYYHENNFKSNAVVTTQKCLTLASRCFAVVVEDSGGNGLEDPGYFSVQVADGEITKSSNFGSKGTHLLGDCRTNQIDDAVLPSCAPGQDVLKVIVKTDGKGEETGIHIFSGDNMATPIAIHSDLLSTAEYEFETCVQPNTCNKVLVMDSGSDGMCCTDGEGYVNAYLNGVWKGQVNDFAFREHIEINCEASSESDSS